MPSIKACNKHYVLIEATFNSKHQGHESMWSGSLDSIVTLKVYEYPIVHASKNNLH